MPRHASNIHPPPRPRPRPAPEPPPRTLVLNTSRARSCTRRPDHKTHAKIKRRCEAYRLVPQLAINQSWDAGLDALQSVFWHCTKGGILRRNRSWSDHSALSCAACVASWRFRGPVNDCFRVVALGQRSSTLPSTSPLGARTRPTWISCRRWSAMSTMPL